MSLDAATSSALSLAAAEAGASSVGLVVVAGDDDLLGSRMLLLVDRSRPGEETVHGSLGTPALQAAGLALARDLIHDPTAGDGVRMFESAPGVEVYAELGRPVRELVIVGAGHIAQPMSRLGALLGFRVWVLDDRPDFATRERFPDAHRVVRADFDDPFADVPPHASTHVLLVTRGHRYDYECLRRLLRADPAPAYIGMIGSQRRVRATYVQLLDEGFPREVLDHIHAPVGLDVGAETPEEIAVAVAAELVLVRRGGTGSSLRDTQRVAERFFNETSQ